MAGTDDKPAEGVDNALKMRNTETAALKRMPVSANSASASSAARKTIKLKPLVPSTGSNPGAQTAGAAPAAKAAPPSILLNRKPAAPPADQTPKFMSTNTAPIVKMAKPNAEKPVQTEDLSDKASATPTKTVSIPRFQNRTPSGPAVAPAAPAAPVSPSAPTISTATVSTPKITRPAAPAAPVSPSAPTISTTTGAMPKIRRPAGAPAPTIPPTTGAMPKITRPAAATVKPTYISTATTTVPKVDGGAPAQPAAPAAPTITQGIQKQAIDQAKVQSGLQEAKPAIKLRPSASPEQAPENLSPAAATIKLSPKTESTVSPMPSTAEGGEAAAAEPAKKEDVTVTTKLPRAKLQLKPKADAAPAAATQQAKLREQGDIANKLKEQQQEEEAQAIAQSDLSDKAEDENAAKDKKDEKANEPNIFFAICAILAFLVIGYTVFALTAQYLNTWEQKKIPVVGFEQIDQSMKK